MSWKRYLLSSVLLTVLLGCSEQTTVQTPVRVAVAASSADVMKEIALFYEKNHNIKIDIISGSSGKLATQIESGAPFDLFIAADSLFTNALYSKKLVANKGVNFTTNRLMMWSNTQIDTLETILANASKISIANPETAPFGEAALHFLNQKNAPKSQLVYGTSIAQVNQYIANQSVDIAFTASSSKIQLEKTGFNQGYWQQLDIVLQQQLVLINSTKPAIEFYNFLIAETADSIFKSHGFNQ